MATSDNGQGLAKITLAKNSTSLYCIEWVGRNRRVVVVQNSKKQSQGISVDALAHYQQQCEEIAKDWGRLRAVIDAYPKSGLNKERMEGELISLKSRLSCDYPVLTYWRKGGYGLSAGINKMLFNLTDLSSLADSAQNPASRVNQTWQEVRASLQRVNGILGDAQVQLGSGKEVHLPEDLLVHNTHRPFPVKKVLKGAGVVMGVLVLVATLYVMRNFLGFWAPGAGDGLVVDASMSNEEKIESVLLLMNEACKQDDVDLFMTVIAGDFRDEKGNGKTKLRVGLQTLHEQGEFKKISFNWSRMVLSEKDGFVYARPIFIRIEDEELSFYVGFKPYRGKLLIATADDT